MASPGTQLQFYRARVEEARMAGEATTLENVRERFRRSEAAWQLLVDRAERAELMREAEALRKAADPPSPFGRSVERERID